jgi:hypothetical protein
MNHFLIFYLTIFLREDISNSLQIEPLGSLGVLNSFIIMKDHTYTPILINENF